MLGGNHMSRTFSLTLNYVILLVENGGRCLMIVIGHGDTIHTSEMGKGSRWHLGKYIIKERESWRSALGEGEKIGRRWCWKSGLDT